MRVVETARRDSLADTFLIRAALDPVDRDQDTSDFGARDEAYSNRRTLRCRDATETVVSRCEAASAPRSSSAISQSIERAGAAKASR